MSFDEKLRAGQIGESLIARWMKRRGNYILPVYEKELDTGKGPRLFCPQGKQLIAPDLLVFNDRGPAWIEAKHKTAFTWHRLTERWVTGIDIHHYLDYIKVSKQTLFPVWLLFLQNGGQAKDSPSQSPSGLFGHEIEYLREHEHHRHKNHGRDGMVYWEIGVLKRFSEINELY